MLSFITLPLLAALAAARPISRAINDGPVAAAWFQGWSSDYTVNNVPWDKYTHVTYSFAITTQDGSFDLTSSGGEAGVTSFVSAAHSHGVKALVSVGGWTGSTYWSQSVSTAAGRTKFVGAMTDLVSKLQLDGLDFDWEYPNGAGMKCNTASPDDTKNFLAFLQELRAANPTLTLTAAAGIKPWLDATGAPSTDVSGFSQVLDYVAIMNYDEFGQWSKSAGPNAALDDTCAPAASQQGSAVSAVKAWTAAGMPAAQLVLGVASYGHAFNVSAASALDARPALAQIPGLTPTASSISAAPSAISAFHVSRDASSELALFPAFDKWELAAGEVLPTECGQPAAKDVSFTFAALVQNGLLTAAGAPAPGLQARFDECSQTPFVYDATKSMLVSYDDARSFVAKGEFIKKMGLKGFAMWEASGDHDNILLDAVRGAVGL